MSLPTLHDVALKMIARFDGKSSIAEGNSNDDSPPADELDEETVGQVYAVCQQFMSTCTGPSDGGVLVSDVDFEDIMDFGYLSGLLDEPRFKTVAVALLRDVASSSASSDLAAEELTSAAELAENLQAEIDELEQLGDGTVPDDPSAGEHEFDAALSNAPEVPDQKLLLQNSTFCEPFRQALLETFDRFDSDKDGKWSKQEISSYFEAVNGVPADEQVFQYIFSFSCEEDSDGSKALTLAGFYELYFAQAAADPDEVRSDLQKLGFDQFMI